MTARPLLMSEYQVRATLDGRMAQMRHLFMVRGPDGRARPVTSPMESVEFGGDDRGATYLSAGGMSGPYPCPLGAPGERLWVKETWKIGHNDPRKYPHAFVHYAAGGAALAVERTPQLPAVTERWRPSVHMPCWASRLTLEVTGVRVERLQDLSEEDARAEGVVPDEAERCRGGFGGGQHSSRVSRTEVLSCPLCAGTGYQPNAYRNAFRALWNQLNGDRATWDSNPWVWVVAFAEAKA